MKKNYSETILGNNNYKLVPFTMPIGRQEPMPIDATCVWYDREKLDQYLKSPLCYPGQIITLVENGKSTVFVIEGLIGPEGKTDTVTGIRELGTGGSSSTDSKLGNVEYFKVIRDERFFDDNNNRFIQNNGDLSHFENEDGDGVEYVEDFQTVEEKISEPDDGDLLVYDGKNHRWTNARIGLGFNNGRFSISLNDKVVTSITLGIVDGEIVVLSIDEEGTILLADDNPDNPTMIRID